MSAVDIANDLDAVIAYLRRRLPELMKSGDNWKVTLHGGGGGDVRAEVQQTSSVIEPRKRRLLEEHVQ